MKLDQLLRDYRPGSFGDDWTWEQEFSDVPVRFGDEFDRLCTDIQERGIREPILLGDDGRVWNGHKRLTCASVLGLEDVPAIHAQELEREAAS